MTFGELEHRPYRDGTSGRSNAETSDHLTEGLALNLELARRSRMEIMQRNLGVVLAMFLCAVVCGTTFLFALFRQFAMVEVAASIATGIEVYFLSSSIGDLLEDKTELNYVKLVSAVALAAGVVGFFVISKWRAS